MPTQDTAERSAQSLLSAAVTEDTAATQALIDVTLELMDLDREKCVVKEAAILRLMQQTNPTAQEKNGEKPKRAATNAESVWETDPEATEWLAMYHRKVAEKIVVECRARQARWNVETAQVVFRKAMLDPILVTDAIGEAVFTLQGSLEKHRTQVSGAAAKLADEIGALVSEVPQLRSAIARIR